MESDPVLTCGFSDSCLGTEQGIYSVNFRSPNTHDFGDGLIVVDNGRINGGGKFCVYRGVYKTEGTTTEATVHVTLHSPGGITIFGSGVRGFHLKLDGAITGGNLYFTGCVVEQTGMKISLSGRKLADLE